MPHLPHLQVLAPHQLVLFALRRPQIRNVIHGKQHARGLHGVASRSFYETFKATREETDGFLLYELGNRQWDVPGLRELLAKIGPGKSSMESYEVEHVFPVIGRRVMLLDAQTISDGVERPARDPNAEPIVEHDKRLPNSVHDALREGERALEQLPLVRLHAETRLSSSRPGERPYAVIRGGRCQ